MSNVKSEEIYGLDVDIVIDLHIKNNPGSRMNRKIVSERLGNTKQILCDWKKRKPPTLINKLKILSEIGDCPIEKFIIKIEKNG